MRGHGHDGAGAIFHKDEVANPDGDFFAAEGVGGVAAGEEADFFGSGKIFGFDGGLFHVGELRFRVGAIGRSFEQFCDERVRGREDDGGGAVNGVDARGENFDGPCAGNVSDGEFQFRALRAADPVALHGDDAVGPTAFKFLQVIDELIGVRGGFQDPLFEFAGFDERVFVAPAVASVDDLLVREDGAAFGTPVHTALFAIGETLFKHAQEEPLVPAIVFGLAGGDFAAPVIAEAEAAECALEFGDVVVGPDAWMRVVLDGGVFGGEAEGVPTHGMEDVEAAHALDAGDDVADGVVAHVAHVHGAGGVGQHFEDVVFGLRGVSFGFEDAGFGPALLPLGFDFLWVIVRHAPLSPFCLA